MAKGLDVGTMNLVSTQLEKGKYVIKQQRNMFLEMDANEVTGQMLQQANILHMKMGNEYVIVGEDALNFSTVMNTEAKRPMKQGILARDEKQAIPMMRLIMERLLGPAAHPKEVVYYTSPGNPVDGKRNILYHQKILEHVLRKMGYDPYVINEGLTVVYQELKDQEFTGMGISCGAGMVNVALAHMGVPLTSFSVQRGGDWIDMQVMEATGQSKDKVTVEKEKSFRMDKREGLNQVKAALAIYYDNLLDYATRWMENELRRVNIDEGITVPVVITGGTSSPAGFVQAFEQRLRKAKFPFEVGTVRAGNSNLFTVSLGCLVAARVKEAELKEQRATAA